VLEVLPHFAVKEGRRKSLLTVDKIRADGQTRVLVENSNSNILMVKPAQARHRNNGADGPHFSAKAILPTSTSSLSFFMVHRFNEGLDAMLGGVVPGSSRLENGELVARVKFSRGSPPAQRVAQDLQDGIQIPLSAGYRVHRTIDDRSTSPVTRTAIDWEPIEV